MVTMHQFEDDVEIVLRTLSRGLLDLHLGVRSGEIVDPFALPESMGLGMQMLSKLCVMASVNDVGDSVHCLSDTARRLAVGDWGIPALAFPFRFAEVKLLSAEPVAPTEECRALAARGQPDDAFEDIHHRQLREIVQRVRTESKRQIYSLLRERIVRKPVYERRELSDFLEDQAVVVADDVLRRWSDEIPLGALGRDGSFKICANCGSLLYPHRDLTAFPDGRCRIGPCLEEVPSSKTGTTIKDATGMARL